MTAITLESLGLSREDITERLIDRMADQMLSELYSDEDGAEVRQASVLQDRLTKLIKERVDARVDALAETHVIPALDGQIDNLVLQQTNKWGEKVGAPVTFIEYLVQRADAYMREEVNFDGKTKAQSDSYSWRSAGERLGMLIDKKLQYAISAPVDAIAKQAQTHIADAVAATVRASLADIGNKLSVSVTTK